VNELRTKGARALRPRLPPVGWGFMLRGTNISGAFCMRRGWALLCVAMAIGVLGGCTHRANDPAASDVRSEESGFVPMFNGKDIAGWEYGTDRHGMAGKGYAVNGDVVSCTKEDGGVLYTDKDYSDFVLRFAFKLTPHANNGIGIRVPYDEGNPSYMGMELQVLDDSDPAYAHLHATQYHGSVYDGVPAIRGHEKPLGEWNEEQITAEGSKITVTLNGFKILDTDLKDVTDPHVLAKHPGVRRTSGRIALLGHGEVVEFKDMRIKTLP